MSRMYDGTAEQGRDTKAPCSRLAYRLRASDCGAGWYGLGRSAFVRPPPDAWLGGRSLASSYAACDTRRCPGSRSLASRFRLVIVAVTIASRIALGSPQ